MTSRRLWLLLTLLAAPLVLYSTTGCQIVFPLNDAPAITNAYTCGCSCNPGRRDVAKPVAADDDDAEERRSDGSVLLGSSDLRMTSEFLVGLRFATLGIPQGATILAAAVQFTAAQTDPNPATVAIRVEVTDDAQPFVNTDFDISTRSFSAPPVDWTSGAWTVGDAGAAQMTSDLAATLQPIVAQPGWTDASSLVLVLDATAGSRIAASADAAGNRAPVLLVAYRDEGATVTARIPVCLTEVDNQVLTPGAPNADVDADANGLPDVLQTDCENRVENTYKGLIGTCGYVPDAAANCDCALVPTGQRDENGDDTIEDYFGFTREICNAGPPVCAEVDLAADCSNFDPAAFAACIPDELAGCAQNGIPPEDCNIDDCLPFVAATNLAGSEPICVAHASDAPKALAFQLFGRRSTCTVEGLTEIEVGEDGREPKQQPITRGSIEIFGGPCPGEECVVGLTTQFALNPITFAVRFASDPTFNGLLESGNSSLTAGTVSAAGVGTLAPQTTVNVGRGQRGSNKKAFLGSNEDPLAFTVDWSGFTCSLAGNLAGAVDGESVEGSCEGDAGVACLRDSPDCDGVGGPCNLPADPQSMVVAVAVEGALVNQPPTADAGADQTVECTSPDGAAFELDGSQSFDPDGPDIRIISWREGSRVGPEVGFDRLLVLHGTLGVGESQTYVLRIIDGFAQADEDTASAAVVDTTPPDVFCNTSVVVPPNKPATFTATATDVCTADAIVPALDDVDCFKINGAGKTIDKKCNVTVNGPTLTIDKTGGVGTHIAWTATAADPTGNVREVACEVVVANPGR